MMRVAIYARVSTSDKDQNPETQLLPLREFVQAQVVSVGKVWTAQPSTRARNGATARSMIDTTVERRSR